MQRVKILLVIVLLFLACGLHPTSSEGVHKVNSGNSIWLNTPGPGTSNAQLKGWNHFAYSIIPNGVPQQVQIAAANPSSQTSSSAVAATTYVVKAGDSLWDIAREYNTTVDTIRALNNMKSDALSIGQKISVSGQNPAVTVAQVKTTRSKSVAVNGSKEAVTIASVEPSRSGSLARGGSILQKAAEYLGTPYRWGGQSPGGFDCSGFVKYVYGQYGYDLPRTAADQASVGVHVDKANLKPGDLVFFACGTSGISHAGIYAGNGKFIHSSSPSSGGVIYSSLSESYYERSFVGARRILP